MPLLVDGYNVLHTAMPPSLAGLDEAGLCRALAHSPWVGDRITVVCDGRVKPHGPAESPVAGIELVYSGAKRSADDVIIDLIGASTAPRRLTVVSSDREIQKAARRRRCRSLSSDQLISLLVRGLGARQGQRGTATPNADSPPTGPLSEDEVRQWLEQFGIDPDELEENKRRLWPPG